MIHTVLVASVFKGARVMYVKAHEKRTKDTDNFLCHGMN
jgi:hypothetical protein